MTKAIEVFKQNSGDVTKAYYAGLSQRGTSGELAVALFRAQKRSTAAKSYRKGKFRHAAYDVKNWSMSEVTRLLSANASKLGIQWGWKRDAGTPGYEWVLYVDLPAGQVSFHSASRLNGPDYQGDWDRKKCSTERIIAYCDSIMATAEEVVTT